VGVEWPQNIHGKKRGGTQKSESAAVGKRGGKQKKKQRSEKGKGNRTTVRREIT